MVTGCGRGTSGMAKNHLKTNIIGWQCAVEWFQTPSYIWDPKNSGPMISSKRRFNAHPVLRQGPACARGRGVWHRASVSVLPLAAPIGLSPPLILTLCGPERVLVVSTEPPDDLSCLTTPGVGRPGDGLLPVPLTRGIQMHTPSPCGGFTDSSTDLCALGCASAGGRWGLTQGLGGWLC